MRLYFEGDYVSGATIFNKILKNNFWSSQNWHKICFMLMKKSFLIGIRIYLINDYENYRGVVTLGISEMTDNEHV